MFYPGFFDAYTIWKEEMMHSEMPEIGQHFDPYAVSRDIRLLFQNIAQGASSGLGILDKFVGQK